MSQAVDLLNSLSGDDVATYTANTEEEHIVVGKDRFIRIPDSLKRLGVQHDKDIETVTFDCPRYWDKHDLSQMVIYINYVLPGGEDGKYRAQNVTTIGSTMHFDWTISNNVTQYKGQISFLICAVTTDADGNEELHWNSELNQEAYISEGLECSESPIHNYPDIITHLLTRMDEVEAIATPEAMQTYTDTWLEANRARILAEIEAKGAATLDTIPEDYTETHNMAKESVRTKADAIVGTVEGDVIVVSDSSDDHLRNLRVFGKTTQVSTTGKNLFDPNCLINAGWSKYNETYYGDASQLSNLRPDITFKPNTQYTISTWAHGSATGDLAVFVSVYYTDGNYSTAFKTSSSRTPAYYTYTTLAGKSVDYVRFSYGYSQKARMWNFMVEEGATATEYEPYSNGLVSPAPNCPRPLVDVGSNGSIAVTVAGKNLAANTTSRVATILNGVTFTTTKDSSEFIIGGTQDGTRDASGTLVQNLVLSPGTYTISVTGLCTNDYINVQRMQGDNGYEVTGVTAKAPKTFTVRENTMVLIQMVVLATSVYNNTPVTVQLEASTTATEYEPHKVKQSINMARTLSGIPVDSGGNYIDSNGQQWICDEIDFDRGVYVQRVRAVEFSGSEDWMTQSIPIENGLGIYLMNVGSEGGDNSWGKPAGQFKLKCTHFSAGLSGTSGTTLNTCAFNNGLSNFLINLDTSVCGTTLTAVKNWMAEQRSNGTPVTVYVALANPVEIPLSPMEIEAFKALHTNYPNTTVLNDAGAHMELTYNVDTKTYVDNGIKQTVSEVMEAIENGSY